ncbi:unnamed protein product [Paramecium sonneborni]|uniref:Uncharacterized protein n=1 Tax=Paramecium sonneborni TaxID=65129 RepID=A0A8S1K686_9CILI|nr:unnamed protein product [Paramecium sonneborni]
MQEKKHLFEMLKHGQMNVRNQKVQKFKQQKNKIQNLYFGNLSIQIHQNSNIIAYLNLLIFVYRIKGWFHFYYCLIYSL